MAPQSPTHRAAWTPDSWRGFSALQQPEYPDAGSLEAALAELRRLPPLITSWEVVLLQMSLAMVVGAQRPVTRMGRFAGQYAKPRSAALETRDGVALPSYRGDMINRPEFTAAARTPDPQLLLRAYERPASP